MPPRSKIATILSSADKAELDKRLIENSFSDYTELTTWLQDRGYEISRSAVGRYGKEFKEVYEGLQQSMEQARAIVEANPDDENALSDAILRVTQNKAFQAVLKEDGDLKELSLVVSRLARASVNQKEFAAEARIRREERAKILSELEQQVQIVSEKRGLNAEEAEFWREVLAGTRRVK